MLKNGHQMEHADKTEPFFQKKTLWQPIRTNSVAFREDFRGFPHRHKSLSCLVPY